MKGVKEMSIPICGVSRMLPERRIYDAGFMGGMQKPDTGETAYQMINNPVEDGDGVLSTDGPGKSSGWMAAVKADYNDGRLIDQENNISKFSKLQEREGLLEVRAHKTYRMCMNKQMTAEIGSEPTDVTSETQSISDTETTDVISETQTIADTDTTDVISETKSISDLVRQLLSQLDLSEEETESFLEITTVLHK